MNLLFRASILLFGLGIVWQGIVLLFHLPPYILPTPISVLLTLWEDSTLIFHQSIPTLIETLLGLFLGAIFGSITAIAMILFKPARFWLMPIIIISQAIPTFAIAPLLVIWFGYGLTAKIITTMLMLFFPIASAFFDGLRRANPDWLNLAKTMRATPRQILWHIQIPAALPALATGLRVATAIAPIGAVIGEWVGASQGLGFLMLNANARMQIDLMFAALFTIIVLSLSLYFVVDKLLRLLIFWQTET